MKAEFIESAGGEWYWVIVKDQAWFVVGQATYKRRRDAKRGLLRFLAGKVRIAG